MNLSVKAWGYVMVIAFINLATFFVITACLGGDAVSGGASGGHYYLAEHSHRVEVSHGIWIYSRIHAISAMFSAPLIVAAGYFRDRLRKKN